MHSHGVIARLQRRDGIVPGGVGSYSAIDAGRKAVHDHLRLRHDSCGRISHSAGKCSRGLTVSGDYTARGQEENDGKYAMTAYGEPPGDEDA